MKLSSCVQVLGLRISAVVAIHLDIHSPGIRSSIENDRATLTRTDSIKQSAKLLSENLRQYYTGDLEGGTPGLLPLPYHWWQCGAMLNTFIDYWYYTGDDQYNAMAAQALEHQIGEYDAFMPANQTRSLGNDDQAFWGMAAMSAAESRLPDLGGGKPSWLSLAQAVFNTQKGRWDQTTCGGGLRWQILFFNNGFNIAARLYKYLGDEIYLDWAERIWEWEANVGHITNDFEFLDGAWVAGNCTTLNPKRWTYNAGVHMAGAAAMWNMVSDVQMAIQYACYL
jgi:mannan endo-1,6-alpha-mannosidase